MTLTGSEFKAELRRLGVTQQWLAKQLNVSPVSVFRWCSGARPVPPYMKFCLRMLERQFREDWRFEQAKLDRLTDFCAGHASSRHCPLVDVFRSGTGRIDALEAAELVACTECAARRAGDRARQRRRRQRQQCAAEAAEALEQF